MVYISLAYRTYSHDAKSTTFQSICIISLSPFISHFICALIRLLLTYRVVRCRENASEMISRRKIYYARGIFVGSFFFFSSVCTTFVCCFNLNVIKLALTFWVPFSIGSMQCSYFFFSFESKSNLVCKQWNMLKYFSTESNYERIKCASEFFLLSHINRLCT